MGSMHGAFGSRTDDPCSEQAAATPAPLTHSSVSSSHGRRSGSVPPSRGLLVKLKRVACMGAAAQAGGSTGPSRSL